MDTKNETSEEQKPTGVGAQMAIDEQSANIINNQIMELDISDIQRNIEYNDDVIIEGSIQHNVEDEYKDKHTEQEAIIEENTNQA